MYNRNPRKAVSFEMQQSDDVEDEDKMSEDEDGDVDTSFNNSWRFGSVAIARQRKILLVHRKGRKSSMMLNMIP